MRARLDAGTGLSGGALPYGYTLGDAPAPGSPTAEGGGGKGVAGGRFPPRETKARTPAGPTGCALPA